MKLQFLIFTFLFLVSAEHAFGCSKHAPWVLSKMDLSGYVFKGKVIGHTETREYITHSEFPVSIKYNGLLITVTDYLNLPGKRQESYEVFDERFSGGFCEYIPSKLETPIGSEVYVVAYRASPYPQNNKKDNQLTLIPPFGSYLNSQTQLKWRTEPFDFGVFMKAAQKNRFSHPESDDFLAAYYETLAQIKEFKAARTRKQQDVILERVMYNRLFPYCELVEPDLSYRTPEYSLTKQSVSRMKKKHGERRWQILLKRFQFGVECPAR